MPYKLKLSEETDPKRIRKRRLSNCLKQKVWAKKNPEKVQNRKRLWREKIRRINVEFVNEIKLKKGCEICGYNNNPIALDFDHLDPKTKMGTISYLARISLKRKDSLLEEIKKCRILCSNCHRIETFNNKQY